MRLRFFILCAVLLAISAPAQGAYNMAIQQAKGAANGGGAPSGETPPTPPPQYIPPPPDPALQATLRNVNNLRVDFEDLDAHPTNLVALLKDLNDAAQGKKPSSTAVTNLAQHWSAAIAGNPKLHAQHQKLAQYVHALFNGAHLSPAQQQAVLDDMRKILTNGGVAEEDGTKVISDLKAIATETR